MVADAQPDTGNDQTSRWPAAEAAHLIRLAAVIERAVDVFGSRDAAERSLVTSAPGLDGRKPVDLQRSAEGVETVKAFLTRVDYGAYS
jgi:putative toxin-antitoxin system antitoxin component (TIGR02293 family)